MDNVGLTKPSLIIVIEILINPKVKRKITVFVFNFFEILKKDDIYMLCGLKS